MTDIPDDGLTAEELAIALGFADTMAEEERKRLQLLQEENEPLIPDEDAPQWWEKD